MAKILSHLESIILKSSSVYSFGCGYSTNEKLFILTTSGVYVLSLCVQTESTVPEFGFGKSLISVPQTRVIDYLNFDMSTLDIMVMPAESLFPFLKHPVSFGWQCSAQQVDHHAVQCKWSSAGLMEGTDCVLAMLTNSYNIHLFGEHKGVGQQSEYVHLVDFFSQCANFHRLECSQMEGHTDEILNLIKECSERFLVTAMAWSHHITHNRSQTNSFSILFTAHSTGHVNAWCLFTYYNKDQHGTVSLMNVGDFERHNNGNISAMQWHQTDYYKGVLVMGRHKGGVDLVGVEVQMTPDIRVTFLDAVNINPDCDIKVDEVHVLHQLARKLVYVVAVKQSHLLMFAISSATGVLQYRNTYTCTNGCISGVSLTGLDIVELWICAQSGHTEVLTLSAVANGLKPDTNIGLLPYTVNEVISDKTNTVPKCQDSNQMCYGVVVSPNRAFVVFLWFPTLIAEQKMKKKVELRIQLNTTVDLLDVLMNHPKQSIGGYWDCFEALRVSSLLRKQLPWVGLPILQYDYDSMSLIQLKVLRILAKMSITMCRFVDTIPKEQLMPFHLLHHCVTVKIIVGRMRKLLRQHFHQPHSDSNGTRLSEKQLQSLDLMNFYLKEVVLGDILAEAELGINFVDDIYNVMQLANEIEYPDAIRCQWCGEKLIGTECLSGHVNSRCVLSLLPITFKIAYKCPFCKCAVCREMDEELSPPFCCPYCDVPMHLEQGDDVEIPDQDSATFRQIDCYEDCLPIHDTDDELLTMNNDSDNDFIVLSDSEEKPDNECPIVLEREKSGADQAMFALFRNVLCFDDTNDKDESIIMDNIMRENAVRVSEGSNTDDDASDLSDGNADNDQ